MQKQLGLFLSGLFFLSSLSPALGYEKSYFRESFADLTHWSQVFNEQQAQPDVPCREPSSSEIGWQVNNSRAILNINQSSPCKVVIQPQGLISPDTNTSGVEFEMWLNRVDVDRNWILHWQSKTDYLGFHIFNNVLYPEKYVQGNAYGLTPEYFPFSFQPHTRYRIKLEHHRSYHQIDVSINGALVATFHEQPGDPQNTGPPGLAGSVGAARNFSYSEYDSVRLYTVTEDQPPTLDVPLLKQTDSQWSDEEYDQASVWSPQERGIGRWGCALTSAVMVFRYFGLDVLPDGNLLTPSSVNAWLQAQSDGYIGEGLLNWRALSRLSQQIASSQQTPTLEMEYLAWDDTFKDQLWQMLAENIPPILALRDHFVVAHGVEGETQLLVRDPGYSVTFRQMEEVLSARIFTPSHTDLSALTLVVPSGVHINNLPGWTRILETTPNGQQTYQVFDLPKPTESQFEILVSNPDVLAHKMTLLAYDTNGKALIRTEVLPAQTHVQSFTFLKDSEQSWRLSATQAPWQSISPHELSHLLDTHQVLSPWIIEQYQDEQTDLHFLEDLTQGEIKMNHFQEQYKQLQEKKWLTTFALEQIWWNHKQQLRYLFP